MTLEQAQKRLDECVAMGRSDPEVSHSMADEALISFLRYLGYNDLADTYEKVEAWYA